MAEMFKFFYLIVKLSPKNKDLIPYSKIQTNH